MSLFRIVIPPQPYPALSWHPLALALPALGLLIGMALSVIGSAQAQERLGEDIKFELPLDCTPGETCWVNFYPDLDPSGGTLDYRCGPRTYDGLKGIVFVLRDQKLLEEGVDVFAVAGGEVIGVRSDMPDMDINEAGGAQAVKGRECGNGIAIRHDDGFRTQYCHLRQNSITLEKGDQVAPRQKIGEVGMSGLSEFPNLEFRVTQSGSQLDPFAGVARADQCGPAEDPLWSRSVMAAFPYQPSAIINRGFAPEKPRDEGARNGLYRAGELSSLSPAIILWADILWFDEGDRLTFQIDSPNGEALVRHSIVASRALVRKFAYAGKNRTEPTWPTGTYKGTIILEKKTAQNGQARVIAEQDIIVE